MQTQLKRRCSTCEVDIAWVPVEQDGQAFCCAGCAAGGPCYCSYDDHDQLEGTMVTPHPVALKMNASVDGLLMTPEVFRRLEAAVDRLADSLPATAVQALVDVASEELGSPAVPAAWELHLGAQRLDTLRRVLAQAQVVQPNGMVIVGSHVVIRDEDGELDAYTIVAPSEANARAGSISPDSPLGKAILGRRVGETAEVVAPGGARWVTVEQVE